MSRKPDLSAEYVQYSYYSNGQFANGEVVQAAFRVFFFRNSQSEIRNGKSCG